MKFYFQSQIIFKLENIFKNFWVNFKLNIFHVMQLLSMASKQLYCKYLDKIRECLRRHYTRAEVCDEKDGDKLFCELDENIQTTLMVMGCPFSEKVLV